jgi:hypothetical protein
VELNNRYDYINPATKYVVFSRCVPAYSKASKRRCSTPTASFDNAVCRQAHSGLSFKNHNVRGFKHALARRYGSCQWSQPLPASHALIKDMLGALNTTYLVAGLIVNPAAKPGIKRLNF